MRISDWSSVLCSSDLVRRTDLILTSPDPNPSSEPAPPGYDRVSHGYAPEGRADKAPPVPLDHIVRDLVETMSSVAQAEMALIAARASLAWPAGKWTSAWGFIAACAVLVAVARRRVVSDNGMLVSV